MKTLTIRAKCLTHRSRVTTESLPPLNPTMTESVRAAAVWTGCSSAGI